MAKWVVYTTKPGGIPPGIRTFFKYGLKLLHNLSLVKSCKFKGGKCGSTNVYHPCWILYLQATTLKKYKSRGRGERGFRSQFWIVFESTPRLRSVLLCPG